MHFFIYWPLFKQDDLIKIANLLFFFKEDAANVGQWQDTKHSFVFLSIADVQEVASFSLQSW